MYTITTEDILMINKKIENQKRFLSEFIIDIKNKEINLLNNTYSANLNPNKYFSELNNRVNSLTQTAINQNLVPLFLTITADKQFHKKDIHGDLKISPKFTSRYLSKLWSNFTKLKIFDKMKKITKPIYLKVFEPHKSGVPHLHILLFIPKGFKTQLHNKFKTYFPNSQNKFIHKFDNGFTGAISYIMKYLNKTFINPNKIDKTFYWYIKYRIIRFTCSRTLVPLSIFRKIRYFFEDNTLFDITKKYSKGIIKTLFDKSVIQFLTFDNLDNQLIETNLYIKQRIPLLETPDFKKRIKLKYKKIYKPKPIPLIIDNIHYINYNHNIINIKDIKIPYSKYLDYDLINLYYSIDLDTFNLHEYAVIKKEMINRKLLPFEIININHYNQEYPF